MCACRESGIPLPITIHNKCTTSVSRRHIRKAGILYVLR